MELRRCDHSDVRHAVAESQDLVDQATHAAPVSRRGDGHFRKVLAMDFETDNHRRVSRRPLLPESLGNTG